MDQPERTQRMDQETKEWGVRLAVTGEIVACDSEAEARTMAETADGELVTRTVFETSWLDGDTGNPGGGQRLTGPDPKGAKS